jgi:hypothetical protein
VVEAHLPVFLPVEDLLRVVRLGPAFRSPPKGPRLFRRSLLDQFLPGQVPVHPQDACLLHQGSQGGRSLGSPLRCHPFR